MQAAARCGVPDFEPREIGSGFVPWVAGEAPDTGRKTNCIVNELKAQNLLVTH